MLWFRGNHPNHKENPTQLNASIWTRWNSNLNFSHKQIHTQLISTYILYRTKTRETQLSKSTIIRSSYERNTIKVIYEKERDLAPHLARKWPTYKQMRRDGGGETGRRGSLIWISSSSSISKGSFFLMTVRIRFLTMSTDRLTDWRVKTHMHARVALCPLLAFKSNMYQSAYRGLNWPKDLIKLKD